MVSDEQGVEVLWFGGLEGITVEVGFCRREVGQVVRKTGEGTELVDCGPDVVVGVSDEGNDAVELGVLVG